ncbi:PspC domain-containing protein [Conexibacter sp. CPCC 206217]|uniref:PspC domain-containing protein n=1 Tax=Conexibacter sp. CPCC 206217 TaxID=3064574 RepID=UPI00271705BB|nr:PspC domain-containing protein [Conexibacter sp. CPCC 206217]MDO8209384.1 PspC domain-containing protein [Conexibacter sp. CPCC 206217]
MTTTDSTERGPRRLERSRDDKVIAGVCGGVARYFSVDATIVRVVTVALLAFGGFGAFLYLAAWLLVPEQGEARPLLGRSDQRRSVQAAAIAAFSLLAIAAVAAWSALGLWFGGWPLLLLVAGGAVVWFVSERGDVNTDAPLSGGATAAPPRPTQPAAGPSTSVVRASAAGLSTERATVDPDAETFVADGANAPEDPTLIADPAPDVPPEAARRRGSAGVTALATGGVLVLLAAAIGLDATDAVDLGWGGIVAVAIVLTGVALVVSAFYGGARGLIPVGLLLAVVLGGAAAAGVSLNGGIGEREYRVTDGDMLRARYELGIGHLMLDLRGIELARGVTHVRADLDVGLLEIVGADARMEDGDTTLRSGRDGSGDGGLDVRRTIVVGRGDRLLEIDAHVGVGALTAKNNLSGDDLNWSSRTIGSTGGRRCIKLGFATTQPSCEGA